MKTNKENRKKKSKFRKIKILIILESFVVFLFLGGICFYQTEIGKRWFSGLLPKDMFVMNENTLAGNDMVAEAMNKTESEVLQGKDKQEEEKKLELDKKQIEEKNKLIEKADKLAKGYDYAKAIKLIKSYSKEIKQEPELQEAIHRYQKEKESLVTYKGEVSHVFFHSLIADNKKAFDLDGMSNGYNYWMTTVSEFKKMIETMYDKGYVLVSIKDVAGKVKIDGKTVMRKKEIKLPAGKIPFVLSQDDVNYYEYMKTDGFATKLLIDKDGNSANEIFLDGKTVIGREYDVVPIIDAFVEEHPDFSYKGAKGIIAVTGYEGVLGYRTNNKKSKTYESDRKEVKKIVKVLKKKGWEFASHSYGHPHMRPYPLEKFKSDGARWKKEVEELIGSTDIYIYPFGEEIEYKGAKYEYLKSLGFQYFCGVYAKPWIHVTDNYVRMTRRNLDGFTMHFYPNRLDDLFDTNKIIDKERPEFK